MMYWFWSHICFKMAQLEKNILSSDHTVAVIKHNVINSTLHKNLTLCRHFAVGSALAVLAHFVNRFALLALIILFQFKFTQIGDFINPEAHVVPKDFEFPKQQSTRLLNYYLIHMKLSLVQMQLIFPYGELQI